MISIAAFWTLSVLNVLLLMEGQEQNKEAMK